MDREKNGSWSASSDLARAILYDRTERRKWLFGMALVPLAMLVIGLWVIDGWLWDSVWRVVIWWGACALVTVFSLLFALYDALAVIREERSKQD
ncbi:MAG: hypothetical protein ORN51_15765 [Akkermansiaceae bacterium]|nr:hypothetical protein [Akkermansiaceae bacterium]